MADQLRLAAGADKAAAGGRRKAGKLDGDVSKKFTGRMTGEMDFRVQSIARTLGLSKAELVWKLVDSGLEKYGLDPELKALYAKILGKAREAA